jgi:hypothetical protein
MYEKVKGKDSVDYANTLNNIGKVYDQQGKTN